MNTASRSLTCVLVANRGEIVRRVFRSARTMGLSCAAVYVDADADAPYVVEADVAVRLDDGGHLDAEAIVAAAKAVGANAVHPGYGFLAENPSFARAVEAAGLTWIGPAPEVIAEMGDKISAKKAAIAAGVPTLPSSDDLTAGDEVGYPLLVKSAAGGGGKGMHLVERPEELGEAVVSARREAAASFSDDRVFLEKYLARSRHIEIQILGDSYGSLVHLGERECSIQRRHQKIIEESPAITLNEEGRTAMGAAALRLAKEIGYHSVGTVEFLLDDASGDFFFLEVNTRLQVEHPVTEEVTGIDLVREQLRIAGGETLGYSQDNVSSKGHAIEVRLYAEDPSSGYLPTTGTLEAWRPPIDPAVRWDAGVAEGSVVGVDFDPMLAKVVSHGPNRSEAASRLALALERMHLGGVATNRDLLAATLRHEAFLAGDTTTDFLDRHTPMTSFQLDGRTTRWVVVAAVLWLQGRNRDAASVLDQLPSGWRNARLPDQQVSLTLAGEPYEVHYRSGRNGQFTIRVDGANQMVATVHRWAADTIDATVDGIRRMAPVTAVPKPLLEGRGEVLHITAAGTTITMEVAPRFQMPGGEVPTEGLIAPMPGKVLEVRSEIGDEVVAGQTLVLLEAMKMEHHIAAPFTGLVSELRVAAGDQVENGAVLLVIQPATGEDEVDD